MIGELNKASVNISKPNSTKQKPIPMHKGKRVGGGQTKLHLKVKKKKNILWAYMRIDIEGGTTCQLALFFTIKNLESLTIITLKNTN